MSQPITKKKIFNQIPTLNKDKESQLDALIKHLQQAPAMILTVLGGFVASYIIQGKSKAIEYYFVHRAAYLFHLSTSLLIFVAIFTPGSSKNLQISAGVVGLILLIRGIRSMLRNQELLAGVLGMAVGDIVAEIPPGELIKKLTSIFQIVSTMSKTPAPTTKPTETKKDATNGSSTPSTTSIPTQTAVGP